MGIPWLFVYFTPWCLPVNTTATLADEIRGEKEVGPFGLCFCSGQYLTGGFYVCIDGPPHICSQDPISVSECGHNDVLHVNKGYLWWGATISHPDFAFDKFTFTAIKDCRGMAMECAKTRGIYMPLFSECAMNMMFAAL